jgi:hypothetical protein
MVQSVSTPQDVQAALEAARGIDAGVRMPDEAVEGEAASCEAA